MDGIINYLNQIDTNIFLYFNGLHNHYWGIAVADMDFRPPTQPTPGVWHSLRCS